MLHQVYLLILPLNITLVGFWFGSFWLLLHHFVLDWLVSKVWGVIIFLFACIGVLIGIHLQILVYIVNTIPSLEMLFFILIGTSECMMVLIIPGNVAEDVLRKSRFLIPVYEEMPLVFFLEILPNLFSSFFARALS